MDLLNQTQAPCKFIVWSPKEDFMDLPDEILVVICEYLGPFDLLHLSQVNKEYYGVINDPSIWQRRCQSAFHCRATSFGGSPRLHYFSVRRVVTQMLHGHQDILMDARTTPPEELDSFQVLEELLSQREFEKASCLLEHGFPMNKLNDEGCTLLCALLQRDDLAPIGAKQEIIQWLLQQGADVNAADFVQWTPLHYAVLHGGIEILEMLVSRGARLRARDYQGQTPLALAQTMTDDPTILSLLRPLDETLSESDSDWEPTERLK